ncbi:MAG: methyltransferase [Gammaproteobacteria bacterium]|nr:methyltransferase [Gammaproteobacteria bacterium]
MDIYDQIAAVRKAINSYQFPQLLITAQETGILEKLSQQPSSASELAEAVGGLEEPIRRLANALVAHSVLNLEDNRYTIADDWSILRSNSPASMIGYIQHMSLLKDRWAQLGKALRDEDFSRESVALIDGSNRQTTETFIAAMDEVAKPIATKLASDWEFDNHRIMDIGGGSGIYSIVVASTNKNVTGIAQKNIKAAGLNQSLATASGDYNEGLPDEGFDDAFLFAMVHRQDEAQNRSLLQRTFKALNRGGRLFLIGFFTNEHGTGPVFSAHFAVEMTVMVPGGRVYSHTEIEKLIEHAGFTAMERIDTIPGPATLYTAIRP